MSCQNLQRSRLSWPLTAFPTKKARFQRQCSLCETKLSVWSIQQH
ncbi:hypothetical protein VCB_000997 [Vibrio cholerae TMA 21]|nr:hypothetical protein VCB_000997 [Vibrio cholerae TMA 21]